MAHVHAPIAIVGAGPVGLSMALGLAVHGVRSVLVERHHRTSERSKAPAIQQRTREVFRQWGVEDRFLEAGVLRRTLTLNAAAAGRRPLASIDMSELDREADRPGLLVLEQSETERLLLEAVRETGLCDLRFDTEAVRLRQDRDGATLSCRRNGPEYSLDAAFVVGCDGADSFVRDALGLPFEGFTYAIRPMLADVRITDERDQLPWPRIHNSRGGVTAALRLSDGLWRIIRLERGDPEKDDSVPDDEIEARVAETLGGGGCRIEWANRFRIHLRSAPRFRVDRVLLAGDAAHVHSPAGALGMNAGIQDAHNLAWKLAAVLDGGDAGRLLDAYDIERRDVVVESVSGYADVLTKVFLQAPAVVRAAAFVLLRLCLAIPPVRRRMLRRATMIDLGYQDSPLLDSRERAAGVRLPNPLLRSHEATHVRLYDLLPNGPAILDVAEHRDAGTALPLERVIRIGRGGYHDGSGLLRKLLGGRDGWIVVRPDRHVALARNTADGLGASVHRALGTQA
ncbi:FAD-dependent monooxygenase [Luteimonas suaedae]|uniref:FAD-dependent monooxygenase n=1 Tax=Luteimonas suaedae TaxID=2605430 RepID=UPI0011EC9384|nr:FAD-dependent monooxygenase [Luteimonas suaedae]